MEARAQAKLPVICLHRLVLIPRSISLHHRIRQPSNPYSVELKAFDTRLQSGEILSIEDLKR